MLPYFCAHLLFVAVDIMCINEHKHTVIKWSGSMCALPLSGCIHEYSFLYIYHTYICTYTYIHTNIYTYIHARFAPSLLLMATIYYFVYSFFIFIFCGSSRYPSGFYNLLLNCILIFNTSLYINFLYLLTCILDHIKRIDFWLMFAFFYYVWYFNIYDMCTKYSNIFPPSFFVFSIYLKKQNKNVKKSNNSTWTKMFGNSRKVYQHNLSTSTRCIKHFSRVLFRHFVSNSM